MSFYKTILLFVALIFVDSACCIDFSKRIVLCEDSDHYAKVRHTFFSSFFLPEIDEKAFFKKCLDKIKSYSLGSDLLNKLDVLFRVYSKLKREDIKLIVTFSSNSSCFGGRFSSFSHNSVCNGNTCFYLDGTEVDKKRKNFYL